MDRFLRALPYLLIMFAVVPLVGFLVSGGSWRAALAYTKQWFKYVGMIALAGLLLSLVIGGPAD